MRLKPRRIAICVLLCALCCALLGACARATSGQPEQVLEEYARALSQGDHGRAYALMTAEFRQSHTRAEFERLLRERKGDVDRAATQLAERPRKVKLEAVIGYGDGDTFRLVNDGGAWRIASDPVDFYAQSTPAEALRSFVRAVERRRYDVVLRFVPNKWADAMTVDKLRAQWEGAKKGEVRGLLRNLKANLGAQIHTSGEVATMPYGDRYEVRFLREDGVWKIEDPD